MAEPQLITRYKADNSDLTRKTKEAERALDQFGAKGTEVGNKIKQLTGIMNLNVGSLSTLAVGLGAAGAALKVAGDAFKQNEVLMDEWNGNVEAAKSVYDGFLSAINTGDITGFLTNINSIVNAAREAYNAMDELGTFNAFNQINAAENRANLTSALANYKAGTGSKEDVNAAADAVKNDLEERQKREQDVYDKAIRDLAERRRVNEDMLRDAMSGTYGNYTDIKNTQMTGKEQKFYGGGQFGGGRMVEVAAPANEVEKLGQMLRQLSDDELQHIQSLGAQAKQTAREIADVDKQVAKYQQDGSGTKTSSTSGTKKVTDNAVEGTIRYYQELIAGLNKQIGNEVDAEVRDKLSATVRAAQEELNRLKTGDRTWNVGHDKVAATQTAGIKIESAAANMDLSGVEEAARRWEEYKDSVKRAHESNLQAASSIGMLGSALQGIEDPAIKTFGIIAEAVANVTLAFAKSLKGTLTPWDFIAGAAAGLATVISTVSAIKSINSGSYADGGIIPGSRYSGDMLTANVNAGELILNRAQQGNLASQLNGVADNGSRDVEFHIASDELVGILRQHANIKSYR